MAAREVGAGTRQAAQSGRRGRSSTAPRRLSRQGKLYQTRELLCDGCGRRWLGRLKAALARRAAGLALAGALRDKLRACQELEDSLAQPGQTITAADWRARWAALLPAGAEYDPVLDARFEAALNAADGDRAGYARLLEANRATLLQELLRQEVAAGIDSGAEFARDRLKLQVEALQSTLKAGEKPGHKTSGLRQLCALPALVDDRTALRIEQLLMRTAREGK